jgi:uncharacterized membrane protein YphA (DoxX/SURF4 family)
LLNSSGYRLCWCACLALVLLRVGVGWHFLYEGLWKIDSRRSTRDGVKPFSAEGYIANSSGPLRQWFRKQLDDADGLERLDPVALSRRWELAIEDFDRRYVLSDEQKQSARKKVHALDEAKEQYFADPAVQLQIKVYREEIERATADESGQPKFIREHAKERLKNLAKSREDLLAPIEGWTKSLRDHMTAELSPEQVERDSKEHFGGLARWLHLPFKLEWPEQRIEQINIVTMLGLTLCGGLLVIGLFSRLAAFGAAALVAAFYVCNPAPPLGPGLPGDPGHYLYVNKELIEFLATLVLASIPTGRWLGVDALIHGFTRLVANRYSRKRPSSS